VGLAAALLLGGCNLFQPRTAVPPSSGGLRTDYSTPEATLGTMAGAIEAKAPGSTSTAYMDALADSLGSGDAGSFIAYFDPDAVVAWHNVTNRDPPALWGRDLERQLFNTLQNLSTDPFTFIWQQDVQHPNDDNPAPDVRVLHRQYVLTATPEAGGNTVTLATGFADLTFIKSKDGQRWVIERWQDRVDPAVGPNPSSGNRSFSALRLGF
jgi:hypothetical protein